MGKKGDKLNNLALESAESLIEKLIVLEDLSSKKMFGGVGIYSETKMFAGVNSKGEIFFKVSNKNRAKYEAEDSHQMGKMPYFSVPDVILNDSKKIVEWAKESIAIAKG